MANCGYSEIGLVSLSTSDYPHIDELVASLSQHYPDLAISLPSLYVDTFSVELMESLPAHKKTGLTFAPEAGSERLRRSINKNISEDELLKTAAFAFQKGWTGLKLYFMLGLPGESLEDAQAIIDLIEKVHAEGKKTRERTPQIRVNLSTFVPKPHTPFQWVAQEAEETLTTKHELLRRGLHKRAVKLSWSDPKVSQLEAALSRGDRRLGAVIYRAWKLGCVFDSWSEHFNHENWARAFAESGLNPAFYANRERSLDELLPWAHIDTGVTTTFLKQEYQRALAGQPTPDCRYQDCNLCGLQGREAACQEKVAGSAK
jgi:radical SAM superfamily enzyme YgiQ (UPF0313 family)